MHDLASKLINELTYRGLAKKQQTITKLFPTFHDRVGQVDSLGGVKLNDLKPNQWQFKVHSGTDSGVWYDVVMKFVDIGADIKKVMRSPEVWFTTGTHVDYNKLAKRLLYGSKLQWRCSCPAFKYWGSAFILSQPKYNAKYTNKETRPPDTRNPKKHGAVCKHLQAVLNKFLSYENTMTKYLRQFHRGKVNRYEKIIKARRGKAERIAEERDSRCHPTVRSEYIVKQKVIKQYLDGSLDIIAEASNDEYTVLIAEKNHEIYVNNDMRNKPVVAGNWMDWWEPEHEKYFGVTEKDYEALSKTERAELEAKLQLKRWISIEFWLFFAEQYHPKEYDTWWFDEGGAKFRATKGLKKPNEYWYKRLHAGGQLSEGIKAARIKYLDSGLIDQEGFDQLITQDPTATKKYLEWLIKEYLKKAQVGEEDEVLNAGEFIDSFDEYAKKGLIDNKDIYRYSFADVVDTIAGLGGVLTKRAQKRMHKKDIEVILDDDRYLVVSPKTKEASVYYGKGTKWCTSSVNDNVFNEHMEQGYKLYYIIPKDGSEKHAIAMHYSGDIEAYDSADRSMTVGDVLEKLSLDLNLFKLPTAAEYIINKIRAVGFTKLSDGSYDVYGSVDLDEMDLDKLPIKFRVVEGHFYCRNNELKTLEGSPQIVGGSFYCAGNLLTTLKGVPKEIHGTFACTRNKLTSLEGGPIRVDSRYSCSNNKLVSLKGAPKKVGGSFECDFNRLTSLEDAPNEVGDSFTCMYNALTSLIGGPEKVGGTYICTYDKLTSLEGSPEVINKDFDCSENELESLEGGPKIVKGNFICSKNKLSTLEDGPEKVYGSVSADYNFETEEDLIKTLPQNQNKQSAPELDKTEREILQGILGTL